MRSATRVPCNRRSKQYDAQKRSWPRSRDPPGVGGLLVTTLSRRTTVAVERHRIARSHVVAAGVGDKGNAVKIPVGHSRPAQPRPAMPFAWGECDPRPGEPMLALLPMDEVPTLSSEKRTQSA